MKINYLIALLILAANGAHASDNEFRSARSHLSGAEKSWVTEKTSECSLQLKGAGFFNPIIRKKNMSHAPACMELQEMSSTHRPTREKKCIEAGSETACEGCCYVRNRLDVLGLVSCIGICKVILGF